MAKLTLIEKLELYDQTFDRICDELGLVKPSWEEKWFYRFLKINPAPDLYLYLKNNSNNAGEYFGKSELRIYYDKGVLNSMLLFRLHKILSFREGSFIKWWIEVMQPLKLDAAWDIERLGFGPTHYDWDGDKPKPSEEFFYQKWLADKRSELEDLKVGSDSNKYAFFAIPKIGNRKQIEKVISNFLKNEFIENKFIVKSKITEKTVKDIFKVFEYKSNTGENDLIKIAKATGALKISQANLDIDSQTNSKQSVRAGMHRLFDVGFMLIRNSSYAQFPALKKLIDDEGEFGVDFIIENYFSLNPKQFFMRLDAEIPPVSNMEAVIRLEIIKSVALINQTNSTAALS